MRILVLGEGDANTRDSWSGTSKSVVDHLREAGHEVWYGDVDLYGLEKWKAAVRTFSPNRKRWWVKYHLGAFPFARRSRVAARHIAAHRAHIDLILQFGATFQPLGRGDLPYALYCDANILLAKHGAASGQTDAVSLSDAELEGVRRREESVYGNAGVILTISDRVRQSFREDFAVPDERLSTVFAGPNFDISRIPYPRPEANDGPPTILFVGRNFLRKGGDLLLRAFARVREQSPDARLVIVGPRSIETQDPGVDFLGLLDKNTSEGWAALRDAYAQADVFCMPTRFEGLSIAFLEAMCFGLPCVSTASPWAYPEMIVDGETGFVVPAEDVDALTDRLTMLLRDKDFARRMGRAGRARVETHFTWPAVVQRMIAAMEPLVEARLPAHR